MNPQWEYESAWFELKNRIFGGPELDQEAMNSRLNDLGRDGWELVAVSPVKQSGGHGTAALLATLKRRISPADKI